MKNMPLVVVAGQEVKFLKAWENAKIGTLYS